jgi:hypothetical protein
MLPAVVTEVGLEDRYRLEDLRVAHQRLFVRIKHSAREEVAPVHPSWDGVRDPVAQRLDVFLQVLRGHQRVSGRGRRLDAFGLPGKTPLDDGGRADE